MVFNEVDCNLHFIAHDKFIQHDIIIGMGIGILSIPWYWIITRSCGYELDIISHWHNASWKQKNRNDQWQYLIYVYVYIACCHSGYNKINVVLTKLCHRFEFVVFLMFRSYLLEEACTRNLVSLEKPMRTFPC